MLLESGILALLGLGARLVSHIGRAVEGPLHPIMFRDGARGRFGGRMRSGGRGRGLDRNRGGFMMLLIIEKRAEATGDEKG